MLITQLFAQVEGSDIIYGGLGSGPGDAREFRSTLDAGDRGPAYEFVSKTAGTLAAIFVIAWVVRHQKDLDGGAEHLKQIFVSYLFGPILTFVLLMVQIDGYSALGYTTLGIRNFNNAFTNGVLSQLAFQVTDPVVEGLVKIQAELLTTSGLQDCLKIANETQRKECLTQLQAKVDKTLAPYRSEQWAQDLETKFDDQVQSLTQNPVSAWLSDRMEELGGFSDQVLTAGIIVICSLISTAATWLIEIIGLMNAFVGPLIIAACLFPQFEEAWKPWLVGAAGIGGVSLLYKFAIGLVSMQVLNSTGPIEMIGPVCLALLGLLLISTFVVSGGAAAFQVGQSTLTAMGGNAVRGGVGLVGGAGARLGRRLRT